VSPVSRARVNEKVEVPPFCSPLNTYVVLFSLLIVASYSQTPFKAVLLEGNYTLTWSVVPPNINIQVSLLGETWAGIGWHAFGSTGHDDVGMTTVDFAVAIFDGTTKLVTDRKSNDAVNNGFTAPALDDAAAIGGVDNIAVFAGEQKGGVTTFSFTRALDTGDLKGDFPLTQSGFYHIIVARGQANKFAFHGNDKYHHQPWAINWATGENKPYVPPPPM